MAVSGLEQRRLPLHLMWAPWGPGLMGPVDQEDDRDDTPSTSDASILQAKFQASKNRSRSWGGYQPYAMSDGSCSPFLSDCSTNATGSDSPNNCSSPCSQLGFSPRDHEHICLETSANQKQDFHNFAKSASSERRSEQEIIFPEERGGVENRKLQMPTPRRIPSLHLEAMIVHCNSGTLEQGCKVNGKTEDRRIKNKAKRSTAVAQAKVETPTNDANGKTTLMIRNLPYSLSLDDLLATLEKSGFKQFCDYCYLPHNFERHTNQGFAFVNFTSAEAAQAFMDQWQGSTQFQTAHLNKPLLISVAEVQGRETNFKLASRTLGRVRNASYRPWMPDMHLQSKHPRA
jgi:hypothetical protein